MLIVCNCCICNCWNCLQDNVMRYGVSSYWWSRQESGYLEILLSALGRPLHPSNRRTLTKRVPTSFWYSSVSEKWEIVTLQKNNQNIPTTGWNLRHLKAYKSYGALNMQWWWRKFKWVQVGLPGSRECLTNTVE